MKWLLAWLSKFFTLREQKDGDVVKPFLEHLEDLRVTLFKMAASLAIGMLVSFFYRTQIMLLIKKPLEGTGLELFTLHITEGFTISLKMAFYAGLVFSFPALLYFAAEFVLPALTRKEKRLLFPGIALGFILFGAGVVASYEYILPKTVQWFLHYTTDSLGLKQMLQAGPYFAFVAHMTLACGLLCELPIVVIALALLDLVSYRLLSGTRPYAIVAILILVAVISPSPDPITFITLALPVLGVYELCIWIVWLIERRKSRQQSTGREFPD